MDRLKVAITKSLIENGAGMDTVDILVNGNWDGISDFYSVIEANYEEE